MIGEHMESSCWLFVSGSGFRAHRFNGGDAAVDPVFVEVFPMKLEGAGQAEHMLEDF